MQTLGLASKPQSSDGLFKRLFWPRIENQYDVDLVGQQGFWLCFVVAGLSLVLSAALGSPWLGLFAAVTYFLGGLGVRERSIAAAVLIFLCYLLDRMVSVEGMALGMGGGNPLVGSVATMLLFANVRATILSRRWQSPETAEEVGELPERTTSSITDKLANSLPVILWPRLRYLFYLLAGVLLMLTILSIVGLARIKSKPAEEPAMHIELAPSQSSR